MPARAHRDTRIYRYTISSKSASTHACFSIARRCQWYKERDRDRSRLTPPRRCPEQPVSLVDDGDERKLPCSLTVARQHRPAPPLLLLLLNPESSVNDSEISAPSPSPSQHPLAVP